MGIDLDVNDSLSLTHPSLNEDSGAPTDSDSEAATETHAPREGHSENATLPTFELSASDGLYHRLQVLTAELGECQKWALEISKSSSESHLSGAWHEIHMSLLLKGLERCSKTLMTTATETAIRHDEASVLAKSSSSSENEYEPFQREAIFVQLDALRQELCDERAKCLDLQHSMSDLISEMTEWETSMHKLHEAVFTRDLSTSSPTSSVLASLHHTQHMQKLRLWLPALDTSPCFPPSPLPPTTATPAETAKAEATVLSIDWAARGVVKEGCSVQASYDEASKEHLDIPPVAPVAMCFASLPYPLSQEHIPALAHIITSKLHTHEGGGGRGENTKDDGGASASVEEASGEEASWGIDRESVMECEQHVAQHVSREIFCTQELPIQIQAEAQPTTVPTQARAKATVKEHSEALSQPATAAHAVVQQENNTVLSSQRLLLPLQQDEQTFSMHKTEGASSRLQDARNHDTSHVTRLQDTRLEDTRNQPSEKGVLFDTFVEADLAASVPTLTCKNVCGFHLFPDQTAPDALMALTVVSTEVSKDCGAVSGMRALWVDDSDLCLGRTSVSAGSQSQDLIVVPASNQAAASIGIGADDCASTSNARHLMYCTTPRFTAITPFVVHAAGQIAASTELVTRHAAATERQTATDNGVALELQQVMPAHGASSANTSARWPNGAFDDPKLALHAVETASSSPPFPAQVCCLQLGNGEDVAKTEDRNLSRDLNEVDSGSKKCDLSLPSSLTSGRIPWEQT